jgi:hypothetical protein
MRVFVVESHEGHRAKESFRSEFKDAGITPRLLEGFEQTLVASLEEMQVLESGDTEIVAGIKVEHTKADGLWTTGYGEHLALSKGQIVLGGYEVSLWMYGPEGPVKKIGSAGFKDLYTACEELTRCGAGSELLKSEIISAVYFRIKDGLTHRIGRINAAVTEHELAKQELLQEHRLLSGFYPD